MACGITPTSAAGSPVSEELEAVSTPTGQELQAVDHALLAHFRGEALESPQLLTDSECLLTCEHNPRMMPPPDHPTNMDLREVRHIRRVQDKTVGRCELKVSLVVDAGVANVHGADDTVSDTDPTLEER